MYLNTVLTKDVPVLLAPSIFLVRISHLGQAMEKLTSICLQWWLVKVRLNDF